MSQFPAALPQAPQPTSDPAAARSGLSAIIRRIEDAIDLETKAIRKDRNFDLAASNARKGRYLYELNRATQGLSPQQLSEEHREGLRRLRAKLQVNEQAILAHLNAVKEVAGMLQEAIRRAETDGTYSAQEFGRG